MNHKCERSTQNNRLLPTAIMVAGLAFLSKKSFNPKNLSNQKTVWEAREQKKQEDKRIAERETQLKREREDEELARVRHGETGGEKVSLSFMYAAPPPGSGADDATKRASVDGKDAPVVATDNLLERQPGDDDAAAAFRAMLAGIATSQEEQNRDEGFAFSNSSGAALQGTTVDRTFSELDGRSALEKAVGRKDGNSALTLEQQVARFPQLQHAPMAKGMKGTDVQVNFKPLGTQLRNVQCLACGVWGHSRGDRECSKSGWDPFSMKGPVVLDSGLEAKELRIMNVEPKVAAKDDKRHRDMSDSDSDDSNERRRREKRRRKEKKRRKRSPSDDDADRKRRYEKDDRRRDRRKEHKKDKKRRNRFDSDSN